MKFDWLKICCEGGLIDFILFLAPCTVSLLRFMVLHYAIGEDMFLSKKKIIIIIIIIKCSGNSIVF
jgi:hypothetical protein